MLVRILCYLAVLAFAPTAIATVYEDTQSHAETFQFSSKENQTLALKLARELRCPQCQNQNLIESNSPVAMNLRLKVYQQVELGATENEVIAYMSRRFGDMVHYQPPFNSKTALLWLAPVFIIIFIGGSALRARRKAQ
ncbi:cytochrome c-type biogenesis protein CcmH [Enterovibrio sp. ZSDZ35]|uniref:Cytochrome c-type biogenesis protein n=1 Tax=Enterovibrio qingdaonensis TaxID=2899818 RepID=A0ABT5QFX9_9GAMM|nr:cytochrome c-type biogenesis protein CcmH [Enterovibrio sp. ZSDZ35]MDD1779892.1 cytochrome c-type biogenesis protein CcmH [Enterovibrio sp. ZSDZ35]